VIRVAIVKAQVDAGTGMQGQVKAKAATGKRLGQPYRARVAAGAPAVQIKQKAHPVAAQLIQKGIAVAVVAGLTTMAGSVPWMRGLACSAGRQMRSAGMAWKVL
jgi:hypothetical protein